MAVGTLGSFVATADAWMEGIGAGSTTNYGTNEMVQVGITITVGKSSWIRALSNFDISSIGTNVINSVGFYRHKTTITGTPVVASVYRCTRPSTWVETGVTWVKYDGTTNWTTAGGDFDPGGTAGTLTPVQFTDTQIGTSMITGLEAFGTDALANRSGIVSLLLHNDNENPAETHKVSWYSRTGVGQNPKLIIDYGSVAGTTSPAFMSYRASTGAGI